jgi:pimeloyl-ACP methyl ester carboxylesterase
MSIRPDNVVTLPDGRALGFAECGEPTGVPILHFHGTPSCRLDLMIPEFDQVAERLGVRYLSIDRPGMGLSDPRPGRTILDWPVDVVGFAEALGLSRFSVCGVSGGAPYAIACALRIPHRLRSVGIVSGLAPANVAEARSGMDRSLQRMFFLGRYLPTVVRWMVGRMGKQLSRRSQGGTDRLVERLPAADREILAVGAHRQHLEVVTRATFRKGDRGPADDFVLASRPWGFDLSEVPMVVNLWFGGQDVNVPPAAGRYLARELPRSEARYYPDEGHLSLIWNRFEEILTGLLATAEREAGRPVG